MELNYWPEVKGRSAFHAQVMHTTWAAVSPYIGLSIGA